ncbi:hypothetical protein Cni_G28096 [Canna indica]|uniref:Uncharacterized protein n=1 Tax=Canna indica TaxID=4628 RepID=A0AAQ3L644_9LILI|nr:hypothetical protein Cni_G28096 [Canna indica]
MLIDTSQLHHSRYAFLLGRRSGPTSIRSRPVNSRRTGRLSSLISEPVAPFRRLPSDGEQRTRASDTDTVAYQQTLTRVWLQLAKHSPILQAFNNDMKRAFIGSHLDLKWQIGLLCHLVPMYDCELFVSKINLVLLAKRMCLSVCYKARSTTGKVVLLIGSNVQDLI